MNVERGECFQVFFGAVVVLVFCIRKALRGIVIIRTKGQKCLLCVMDPASGVSGGPR